MSTACKLPTSSTLSSTMSARARAREGAGTRDSAAAITGSPQAQELLEHVVHELGIRRPFGFLHHLPHEEPEEIRLARPQLPGLLGVLRQEATTDRFEAAPLPHLPSPQPAPP